MIDIGANLTNSAFDGDRQDVLRRAGAAGVRALIITGTSVAASRQGLELARGAAGDSPPRLYATAGVHPHDAEAVADGWLEEIAELAADPLVVAIGETGLDHHRNYSTPAAQRRVFERQLALAATVGKPVFVHDRDSRGETARCLAAADPVACVVHCFTGTAADLDRYLADGHHIGVTGWICDERRGQDLCRLVAAVPRERLLIETDAPFLLPRTMTGKPRSRRNEPAFLPWVARRVAECRGEPATAVAAYTAENAERFFGLGDSALAAESGSTAQH